MRVIDEELARKLVREFAHGLDVGFDPATSHGSQRESLRSLGFGWLYFALAQIIEPRRILVVGSGRGFSVACFALGIERNADAQLVFVDPGYAVWPVEGRTDAAAGLWKDATTTASHFASSLGLHNVRHLPLRSDEAFAQLRRERERFDLVFIDGEHSYKQASADLRSAWELLSPNGLLMAHDAHCPDWPGVALAIAYFEARHAEAQAFTLPLYPGVALIQRRVSLLTIRRATAEENERINQWRRQSEITARPLGDPDDPRVGIDYEDPRIGLFSILEDGELIGGVGMKYCTFTEPGADNFQPDDKQPLAGFLTYGAVIRPDKRGRGRFQFIILEMLRWCGADGYYFITADPISEAGGMLQHRRVGDTPGYVAYHRTLRNKSSGTESQIENDSLRREIAGWRRELERSQRALSAVLSSRSWRAIALLRRILNLLRRG